MARRFALRVMAELASHTLVHIMREKRGQKQCLCVCACVCVCVCGGGGGTKEEQETQRGGT